MMELFKELHLIESQKRADQEISYAIGSINDTKSGKKYSVVVML